MSASTTTTPYGNLSVDSKQGRRQNHRGKALSAMAWTTVILASPALGLTGVQHRAPHTRLAWKAPASDSPSCQTGLTRSTRCSASATSRSKLRYRDGDEDECTARRREHDEAASHIAGTNSPAAHSNFLSKWWGSIIRPFESTRTPQPAADRDGSEQYVLDDYLEFIEKRYHRLHDVGDNQLNGGGRPGIIASWNWLKGEKTGSEMEDRRKKEDALCVLGLAELASAELLQKHQLPVPKKQDQLKSSGSTSSVVIDAQVTSSLPTSKMPKKDQDDTSAVATTTVLTAGNRVANLSAGVSVLRRIHERQVAITALRLRAVVFASIRASAQAFTSAAVSAVGAVPALLAMGGGAKALKATTVVAAAMVMFLRPLGTTAMKA